jgi:hypothetical protein
MVCATGARDLVARGVIDVQLHRTERKVLPLSDWLIATVKLLAGAVNVT